MFSASFTGTKDVSKRGISAWLLEEFELQSREIFCETAAVEDLGNQVLHSTIYKEACKKNKCRQGRLLSVPAGEWFMGLPRGWTSPRPGDVSPQALKSHDIQRMPEAALSCFETL